MGHIPVCRIQLYIPVNQAPPIGIPWSAYLGVLRLGGSTAYMSASLPAPNHLIQSGVNEIEKFKSGETAVLSSAFGTIDQVVCQVVKLAGMFYAENR